MLPLHRILLPTPYPVGPVNAYLILSDPYTLIDAGPDTGEARDVLQKTLAGLGLGISDIKRVVITHAHHDHSGLAGWLQKVAGLKVFVHPVEMERMLAPGNFLKERIYFLKEAGMPQDDFKQVITLRDKMPETSLEKTLTEELKGGEEIAFADGTLQVCHFPGHAPGHLCFYDPRSGNFFSGDFLLPDITPNPMVEFDPERPGKRLHTLQLYLDGLKKVKDMKITKVWPGHGEAFSDHRKLVENCREHHESRMTHILNLLQKNGEMTTYQLTRLVYPELEGFDIFLGLSEIQAHLDVLCDRNLVSETTKNGVYHYRPLDTFQNSRLKN